MIESINDPISGLLNTEDFELEDFESFVSTFTNAQFEQLVEACNNVASLYYKDVLICPRCGNKSEKEYKSLLDFFV